MENKDISSLADNSKIWNELYAEGKNNLEYPSDVFIRCCYQYLGSDVRKVLDYGCGTGANLIHLARRGLEMSGLEISEHAISIVRERLLAAGLKADLQVSIPGDNLIWSDGYFDAVIAWQVLCYNDWTSFHNAFKELDRVLCKGGIFIAAIKAPGDITSKFSTPLGDHLYRSNVQGQNGCIVLIPDEAALSRCFPKHKIQLGEFMYSLDKNISRHWIIVFQKDY